MVSTPVRMCPLAALARCFSSPRCSRDPEKTDGEFQWFARTKLRLRKKHANPLFSLLLPLAYFPPRFVTEVACSGRLMERSVANDVDNKLIPIPCLDWRTVSERLPSSYPRTGTTRMKKGNFIKFISKCKSLHSNKSLSFSICSAWGNTQSIPVAAPVSDQ